MSRLFFGNFEFEHHLNAPGETMPAHVQAISAELCPTWAALAEEGDLIWSPSAPDATFVEQLVTAGFPHVRFVSEEEELRLNSTSCELKPWGWSTDAKEWGRRMGLTINAPTDSAVFWANSRITSSRLERTWNCGLDGAVAVQSVEEFVALLREANSFLDSSKQMPWVLKAEFGMSGRERFLGRGNSPTPQAIQWVQRRLERSPAVLFEPWVERIEEFGLQFEIGREGESRFVGATMLINDMKGQYRGSRLLFPTQESYGGEHLQESIEVGSRAVNQLAEAGYFGPVGIDAMVYVDSHSKTRLRPLQDINARMTMGRLALGLKPFLNEGELGSWLHVRTGSTVPKTDWHAQLKSRIPDAVRIIQTSPDFLAGHPVRHRTFFVASPSIEQLLEAERTVLEFFEGEL